MTSLTVIVLYMTHLTILQKFLSIIRQFVTNFNVVGSVVTITVCENDFFKRLRSDSSIVSYDETISVKLLVVN